MHGDPQPRRDRYPARDADDGRPAPTVGDLAEVLKQNGATWSVNPRLEAGDPIPRFALGGSRESPSGSHDVPPIDFAHMVLSGSTNPFLVQRAIDLGVIDLASAPRLAPEEAEQEFVEDEERAPPDGPPGGTGR